jgi:hypothetical protein
MEPATRTLLFVVVGFLLPLPAHDAVAEKPKSTADRYVGLKFEDPRETEFLKAVLTSLGHAYAVTMTPTGELVEWASTDTTQEQEIQSRVSQYWLTITQCKGTKPPLPSQPARKYFSCEG